MVEAALPSPATGLHLAPLLCWLQHPDISRTTGCAQSPHSSPFLRRELKEEPDEASDGFMPGPCEEEMRGSCTDDSHPHRGICGAPSLLPPLHIPGHRGNTDGTCDSAEKLAGHIRCKDAWSCLASFWRELHAGSPVQKHQQLPWSAKNSSETQHRPLLSHMLLMLFSLHFFIRKNNSYFTRLS